MKKGCPVAMADGTDCCAQANGCTFMLPMRLCHLLFVMDAVVLNRFHMIRQKPA